MNRCFELSWGCWNWRDKYWDACLRWSDFKSEIPFEMHRCGHWKRLSYYPIWFGLRWSYLKFLPLTKHLMSDEWIQTYLLYKWGDDANLLFWAQLYNWLPWDFTDCPARAFRERLAARLWMRNGPQSTELGCGIASPLARSDCTFLLDQGPLNSSPRLFGRPLCSMFFYFFLVVIHSFLILQSIEH